MIDAWLKSCCAGPSGCRPFVRMRMADDVALTRGRAFSTNQLRADRRAIVSSNRRSHSRTHVYAHGRALSATKCARCASFPIRPFLCASYHTNSESRLRVPRYTLLVCPPSVTQLAQSGSVILSFPRHTRANVSTQDITTTHRVTRANTIARVRSTSSLLCTGCHVSQDQ